MGDFDLSRDWKPTWSGLIIPSHHSGDVEADIRPLSAEEHEIQLAGLAQFERNPEFRCIWQFDADRGTTPGATFEPGLNQISGTDYSVVSAFAPGRLTIHSPTALRAGIFQFGVSHGVLFDSNLYNRITQFVDSSFPKSDESNATQRLIEAIVARKYDFQMLPYVVESFCVNSVEDGWRYAHLATKAILTLHIMKKELFLSSGRIETDPTRLQLYRTSFGTIDLDEIVDAQLEPYRTLTNAPIEVKLWHCSLMKMVLIRRIELPEKPIAAQFAAFDDYMFGRLGMVASKLRFMALFYFGGKLDKWIRVQRNSIGDRAVKALANSAWDIYLGRLPDQILADSPDDQPCLTYFCTRERQLASYLSVSQTYILTSMKSGGFKAFDVYATESIIDAAGSDYERILSEADRRMESFLDSRSDGAIQRIEAHDVLALCDEISEHLRTELP